MEVIAIQLAGNEKACPSVQLIDQQALALLIEPTGQYGFAYTYTNDGFLPRLDDQQIVELLNRYGPVSVLSYLDNNRFKYFGFLGYQFYDLTGDGINELILLWGRTRIYSCINNQYILLKSFEMTVDFHGPEVIKVSDENRNGYPEFIVGLWPLYGFFEYNGEEIIDLLDPEEGGIRLENSGKIDYRDHDEDGEPEIFVDVGLPAVPDREARPWRNRYDTYEWDGEYFKLTHTEFSAPDYRFQAVYDGDRHTLSGDYPEALSFYQDAVFSDKLDWWSFERSKYLLELSWWTAPEKKAGRTSTRS